MPDTPNTIRVNWRTHFLCGLLLALITIPLVVIFRYLSLHRFDASRPHVAELKQLADHTPVYPEFQRIHDDQIFLTQGTASLQSSFKSDAKFADVQNFYDSVFLNNGWKPLQGVPSSIIAGKPDTVIYDRDEYQVFVCRRMSQPDLYDIWYTWAAK